MFSLEIKLWLVFTAILIFVPIWFLLYKSYNLINILYNFFVAKYQYKKNLNQLKKQLTLTSNKISKALIVSSSNQKPKKKKINMAKLERIKIQALAAKERGNLDMYEKKLIEALSIDPENVDFLLMLATYYFNIGKYKKVLPLLKRILDIQPNNDVALWQMSQIYFDRGDIETSLFLINKAIEINPKNPKYYITLAEIYYNQEDYPNTIKYLQECINLRPGNINYLLSMAAVYEDIGDKANAKKYYFKVLEYEPTNEIAKEKISTL